jgi:hypothetical protein
VIVSDLESWVFEPTIIDPLTDMRDPISAFEANVNDETNLVDPLTDRSPVRLDEPPIDTSRDRITSWDTEYDD